MPAKAAMPMPTRTPTVGLAVGPSASIVTLATTDATQLPIRNLPSIAMLLIPDRSDRMPANAPSEMGAA